VSLYTLSKGYGMASRRVGYMVIPDALWGAVNKIQDTLLICPPAVSQCAAVAALTVGSSWATNRLATLDTTRRRMREALGSDGLPVDVAEPEGAFYFFMRVRSDMDPMTLTERLVREHKVAVMPGSAFGASGCAIRVSYGALAPDTVAEGLGRLVTGLRVIVGQGREETR
jgi:aspartate/methionine/tyrosine aminotransferase